jgi:hypothetical protein
MIEWEFDEAMVIPFPVWIRRFVRYDMVAGISERRKGRNETSLDLPNRKGANRGRNFGEKSIKVM